MKRKSLLEYNCSWAQAAEAIGDKWLIMIIRDAFKGINTFSGFYESIGISKNILKQRLDHLTDHKILIRKPVRPGSNRMNYILSPKGKALFPVLIALGQWGDTWVFGSNQEPVKVIDRLRGKPVKTIVVEDAESRALSPSDVTYVAGNGASAETRKTLAHLDDAAEV